MTDYVDPPDIPDPIFGDAVVEVEEAWPGETVAHVLPPGTPARIGPVNR